MITQARFDTLLRTGSNYAEHFGVKGMKWGVIRKKTGSALDRATNTKTFKVLDAATDIATIGNTTSGRVIDAVAGSSAAALRGEAAAKDIVAASRAVKIKSVAKTTAKVVAGATASVGVLAVGGTLAVLKAVSDADAASAADGPYWTPPSPEVIAAREAGNYDWRTGEILN